MKNYTSPAFYHLLVTVVLLSLYWLYGRTHFYRDPGSTFFNPQRAYERRYSSQREAEAQALLQEASAGHREVLKDVLAPSTEPGTQRQTDICVALGTVKRDVSQQYVDVALASILEGLSVQERSSVYMSLLFEDTNPTEHPTYHQPWLELLIEEKWTYEDYKARIDDGMLKWIKDMAEKKDVHSKSIMDYSLLLQRCLDQTSAPFIAAFEDDVLVAKGWVARTLSALRKADTFTSQHSRAKDWLDLRMFNQERSTGWASRRVGANHEFYIIFGADLAALAIYFLLRKRSTFLQRYVDLWSLGVICLFTIPALVVTFFQSGKASLLPPRPGLVLENFGCCSQALVFNRKQVEGLITHLRNSLDAQASGREDVQYDMRTRDFARIAGLERLAFYPMQVQHVGLHSAAGTVQGEAQAVWSMAFEDLSPSRLEREHDRAMIEVYGASERNG